MSNCNHDPQHMRVDLTVTRKDWRRSPILSSAVALTLVASMMPTPAIADSSTAESTTIVASTQDTAETSATGETTSTTETIDSASSTATETSNGKSGAAATDNSDGSSASTGTTTGSAPSATTEATAAPVAAIASTTSSDNSATATPAASTVTVRYNANGGSFASGVSTSATGTVGSTITLPTATDVSLVDNKGTLGHLAGWSTRPNATAPDYQPGSSYVISGSNVTLYAVWYETLTLAPTLENLNGYYMVVDANGNILKDASTGNSLEGDLSGAVSFTLPRINTVYKTDYYVNVFVKPYDNYLLTRLDAERLNNFIYLLSGTYYGTPGNKVSSSDIQRMKDNGYVATFGWTANVSIDNTTLNVVAAAIQPTPEASITPDKTSGLKEGDTITLTVKLKAGDINNKYSATLDSAKPVTVYIGDSDTKGTVVSNITSNGDDTYTGTVTYTVTAADIAANVLKARVEATFNYKYAFGVRGDDTVRHDLNTTATIDSKSETIEINGIAATHTINYEYSFEGAGYQGSTTPTGVTFPSLPSSVTTTKGNTVEVSQTPKVGDTVRDDARGGNWKFLGWTLYENAVTNVPMGDDDLTLEGRWEFVADTVNLTYDANAPEGSYSGSTATTSGYVGNVAHVAQNGFTREGYRFLNWNTAKDGTGAWFPPTTDYLLPVGGGTLYAQWAEGHRVSYQYNYVGANGIDSSAYPESITLVPATSGYLWPGEKVAVSTAPANGEVVNDPANHGYWTFGGWRLAGQAAGSTVTMGASDAELLGTWAFTKYATLSYDGNGAESGSVDGAEGAPGSAVGVAENGFEREGWRFAGWNTEPDGSGTSYDPADPLTLPQGATTLYAQWEKVENPAAAAPMTISEPTAKTTVAAPTKAPLPQTSDATTQWPLVAGIASIGAALVAAAVLVRRRMNSHNE